jgi:hypothetical protein
MGMPPEYRHSAAYSFMACAKHHRAYDAHRFALCSISPGVFYVVKAEPKSLRRRTA